MNKKMNIHYVDMVATESEVLLSASESLVEKKIEIDGQRSMLSNLFKVTLNQPHNLEILKF